MATLNFNANEVEPNAGVDPIPAGKYTAVIVDSEMKATKSGSGQFLELTFEVVEGTYQGRKVWARLNISNPNQTAEKIAKGDLSAICRAVNVMEPKDSGDLHNLPMEITVKCKKRDDSSEFTNEIKSYAKKGASANTSAPPPQKPAAPPWKRPGQ